MKKTIAVIFGGRSGEHEVSLVSASAVIDAIDREKYEVLPIGIAVSGQWYSGPNCLEHFKNQDFSGLSEVAVKMSGDAAGVLIDGEEQQVDVVFPVLHGPFGEDGTIQGLFEMMQVPYVGSGVLASSTGMDKLQCKAIWESAGLPVVEYVGLTRLAWEREKDEILADVEERFGYPLFIKPANMGSSVGVSKAKNEEELVQAIEMAAKFDHRILVERGLNVREIECGIIGNHEPEISPPGEVIVGGEFYDFYDKYVDGKSSSQVPAELSDEQIEKVQELALKAYKLLDCSGLARMDLFVDKDSGEFYLNEINTMPGFTSISMYSKLMAAKGMTYPEVVERLIELGIERFQERQNNQVVFSSESDWFKK